MTTKEVNRRLFSKMLPSLPGWCASGRLLLRPPVKPFIRGVYFDSSAYDRAQFNPIAFVQLTCDPVSYFTFRFSQQLSTKTRGLYWRLEPGNEERVVEELLAAIHSEAMPLLEKLSSLAAFAVRAEAMHKEAPWNPTMPRQAALAWFAAGDVENGRAWMAQAIDVLRGAAPGEPERIERLERLRDSEDLKSVAPTLEEWENQTISGLNLSDYV